MFTERKLIYCLILNRLDWPSQLPCFSFCSNEIEVCFLLRTQSIIKRKRIFLIAYEKKKHIEVRRIYFNQIWICCCFLWQRYRFDNSFIHSLNGSLLELSSFSCKSSSSSSVSSYRIGSGGIWKSTLRRCWPRFSIKWLQSSTLFTGIIKCSIRGNISQNGSILIFVCSRYEFPSMVNERRVFSQVNRLAFNGLIKFGVVLIDWRFGMRDNNRSNSFVRIESSRMNSSIGFKSTCVCRSSKNVFDRDNFP